MRLLYDADSQLKLQFSRDVGLLCNELTKENLTSNDCISVLMIKNEQANLEKIVMSPACVGA